MATFIPVVNIPTQFQDNDGTILNGGSLEFFLAGTTTTTELFSDNTGTSIGTSVDINSFGFAESGGNSVFLFRDQSKALKIVIKNSSGTVIPPTLDNIPAVAAFDSTASAKLDGIQENADVTDAENVAGAGALMTDGSQEMTADLDMGDDTFIKWSTTSGITASTTQTQGQGALTSSLNEVAVVANANDTVTMPIIAIGREVKLINNGVNTLRLWPASGGNISGAGVDTATTLAAGNSLTLVAYDAINWSAV